MNSKIEITNTKEDKKIDTIENAENNNKKKFTIFGYSFWRIFSYFVIYSFIGFITETIYGLLTQGVLESRKSMLVGPLCSIYGLGAICLICIPKKLKKNNWYLFLAGIIIGSVVEYAVSWIGECIYHVKWWDYSMYPFNLNGRICVLYSVFWGFLTIALNKFVNPRLDKCIDKVKKKISLKTIHIILILIMIFYIIDFLVSSFATKMFFTRVIYNNNIEDVLGADEYYDRYLDWYINHPEIRQIVDSCFSDEIMLKTFPNLKITLKNGEVILIKKILNDIQPYYFKVFTPKIIKME